MAFVKRHFPGIKDIIDQIKTSFQTPVFPKGMIAWFDLDEAPEGWAVYRPLLGRYPLGATSYIGGTVEAGLPNITGGFAQEEDGCGTYGAFYIGSQTRGESSSPGGNNDYWFEFDASRCSDVYGNSDTVTPPSVRLLPCIKL